MAATVALTLTQSEWIHAAMCGVMRQAQNMECRRRQKFDSAADNPWLANIYGAFGEIAVAKYLRRYWTGMGALGDFRASDVSGCEVRTIMQPHYGLIIYTKDKDDAPFVLVNITGEPDWTCVLLGWLYGRDAKHPCYSRQSKGWAHFFCVPQADLRPMHTLQTALGER